MRPAARAPAALVLLLPLLLGPPVARGDCGLPPEVPNALPDLQGLSTFPEGTEMIYTCIPGFVKVPGRPDSAFCGQGQWSELPEFCNRSCDVPPRLLFASLQKPYSEQNYFPVGSSVEYECRAGFQRVESLSRKITCLPNLMWSKADEFCKKKSCPNPGEIRNGHVIVTTDILYGASITFSCNAGYKLVGADSSYCFLTGDMVGWSDPLPKCKEIVCPEPPEIDHAVIQEPRNTYIYSQSVSYKCAAGFTLVGENVIHCTAEAGLGVWSSPRPVCKETPPEGQTPVMGNSSASQTTPTTQRSTTAKASFAQSLPAIPKSTAVHTPVTQGLQTTQRLTSSHVTAAQRPAAPRATTHMQATSTAPARGPPLSRASITAFGIHCDPPPAVPYSHSSYQPGDQLPLNSVLKYRCIPNFRLIGEATMICVSKDGTGSWDKAPPVCEAKKHVLCQEPVVPGGYRDRKARPPYRHGDSVTFTCNANFTMKGRRTVWCRASGRWGPSALPVCESDLPMECPPLPALRHGQHTGETAGSFAPGFSVNSSCQSGYLLVGPKTISCLSSGEWSASLPTCEEARCQPPAPLPHGRVQEPPSPGPGSIASFSCEEGYRLLGSPTSSCVINEQQAAWTKMPVCEEILCPPPPPALHGTHSGSPNTSSPLGSTVSYTCNPGPEPGVTFVLIGEATLRCIADHQYQGIWNGPAPRCELSVPAKPCPPPQISRGYVSAGLKEQYVYNDTVLFTCKPGFTLKGSLRARCQASGTWHPAVPLCEKACLAPPQVPNGRQEGSGAFPYEPGTSVSYSCDPGFELAAAGTIYCSPDGLWMPTVPQCQEAECRPNGQRLFQRPQGHFIRTPVSSSCGEGFQLGDSVYQPCQGTELWFVEERLCREVTCPPPPRIHNGTHTGSPSAEVPYGTTVTYKCQPGPERGVEFALVGEHTLRCISAGQAGGMWSAPAPTCRLSLPATLCPPVHVDNGYMVSDQDAPYSYNASVVLACKPGFTLKGSTQIRCGPGGSWDPEMPVCERETQCQPMGDTSQEPPPGAHVVPANASCQDGFRQTGFAHRKCEDIGQGVWFQRVPLCEALQCPPPPLIDHGKHSGGAVATFPYGSRITYVCEPGFHLQGQESLQCGGHAAAGQETWSGPAPQCLEAPQERSCPRPEVRHGHLQPGPSAAYPHHSTVHVECDPGFIMNGSQVIHCQPNNTWAPTVPTCIKRALRDCPRPLLIPNGNHTGGDRAWFPPGMAVLYGCDQGYLLEGVALLVCTVAGTWSQPTPSCTEVNCSSPAQVEGVQRGLEPGRTYQYGAIVTVECADGYTLEGSSQSQCEDDRGWNPPLAVCRSQGPLAPVLFGLSAGLVFLFCLVVVTFCMILKHKERNYYTNARPKEDLNLETREVYSMGPYDPAS